VTQPPGKAPNLSRPELASELVHDILKHKLEERRRGSSGGGKHAAARQRRFRLAFAVLFPIFVGLAAWNITAGRQPPAVFTQEEIDAGVRFKIFLAVQALKAYRDSTGQWPASLVSVGFADEGLTYQQRDTFFVISAMSGDVPYTYRSGEDLTFFRDAPQVMMQ